MWSPDGPSWERRRVGMEESLMREGVVGKYVKEESLNKGREDRRSRRLRLFT